MTDIKNTPVESCFHTFLQVVDFFHLSQCQEILIKRLTIKNSKLLVLHVYRQRVFCIFCVFCGLIRTGKEHFNKIAFAVSDETHKNEFHAP